MKLPVVIIFFLLSITGYAQQLSIDSLDKLIRQSKSDTARINLVIKKVTKLIETNIDSSINLGLRTIEESQRIDYKNGEGYLRIRVAIGHAFKGNYAEAAIDLKMAEQIFADSSDANALATLYSAYGAFYGIQSKYDSSILYLEKCIRFAEAANNKNLLNRAYQNLGTSHQMQSNYAQALVYFQKALNSAEKENDIYGQAYINLNMGLTYYNMEDTTRAEQVLLKAVDLGKKTGAKNVVLYAYSNLSSLYETTSQYQKAYDFAMNSATLAEEMNDQGIKAANLSKASLALARQQKLAEAQVLASQAISVADSAQQPLSTSQAYASMGYILKMQNRYAAAIPFYERSIAALKDANVYDLSAGSTFSNISECYQKTGDFKKALEAFRRSAEINDSVKNRNDIRKATELAMNYEFDKKQQAATAEQQRTNAVAKTRQGALLIGLVLTLMLLILAFYAYRNKRKANSLLENQKSEIQSTLSELRVTQAQLIQSEKMASLGELTAGIAHEIQNPLNFVNNFSDVNKELLTELKEEIKKGNIDEVSTIADDVISNEEKINHHGKRADAIVKGMLQHSRTSSGQKELTDINALCNEYLRLSYHGIRAKDKLFNATIQTDFDKSVGKINIIPQDIGRVLLNLYNNAFYAVDEKKKKQPDYEPVVSVSTKRLGPPLVDGGKVEIKVKDNGTGIPQKVLNKIFQPFFTTKPTGEGTGLGLSLTYDSIRAHGGDIRVDTREDEFTEFAIQLPVV